MEDRVARIEEILRFKQPSLSLFLDGVNNAQNLSAILRTSESVGLLHLYYAHAKDYDLRIHKTITQGAHRWVEKERINSDKKVAFLEQKKREGFSIVVTHLDAKACSFREVDYTQPTMLVVGNEKEGVSSEVLSIADRTIMIEMHGMVQSLNVSVATALVLYEAQAQREKAGYYAKPQLSEMAREEIKEAWLYRDVIARRSKGTIPLKNSLEYADKKEIS